MVALSIIAVQEITGCFLVSPTRDDQVASGVCNT